MSDVKPLSAEEEAALRSETARWNPRYVGHRNETHPAALDARLEAER